MSRVVIRSNKVSPPPTWAVYERMLIDRMNEAAIAYQEHYTLKDGTFHWREEWPGFDGSDDALRVVSQLAALLRVWAAAPSCTSAPAGCGKRSPSSSPRYGQIYREYDANYDWMHHGESSIYFYYFGLADPNRQRDRARTLRFAAMYMGEDPEADNWDAQKRMMRSPITGSRGPRIPNEWDDWATHRAILAHYPAPYEDIPGVDGPIADWNDDKVYAEILKLLNERMMRCDVPLNLTSTSLITHAYLYTGEDKYRRWVLDYLGAWAERIEQNGWYLPRQHRTEWCDRRDHGRANGGGGYYGWRWPHGFMSIIQPLTISAMNAVLLTGDMSYLDIPRSQLDRMIDMGHEKDGALYIPNRHHDAGWSDLSRAAARVSAADLGAVPGCAGSRTPGPLPRANVCLGRGASRPGQRRRHPHRPLVALHRRREPRLPTAHPGGAVV